MRAEFRAVTEHRHQAFVAGREFGGHVVQRAFGLGEAALQLAGVRRNFAAARRPRAAQLQNIFAGMTEINSAVGERLHQKQAASAFGFVFRQFDFARPVEAGGVVGDARLDVAFAAGDFDDDGKFPRGGRGIFDGVVDGFHQGEFPRAEVGFGQVFFREPRVNLCDRRAHSGKFAGDFQPERSPMPAARGRVGSVGVHSLI